MHCFQLMKLTNFLFVLWYWRSLRQDKIHFIDPLLEIWHGHWCWHKWYIVWHLNLTLKHKDTINIHSSILSRLRIHKHTFSLQQNQVSLPLTLWLRECETLYWWKFYMENQAHCLSVWFLFTLGVLLPSNGLMTYLQPELAKVVCCFHWCHGLHNGVKIPDVAILLSANENGSLFPRKKLVFTVNVCSIFSIFSMLVCYTLQPVVTLD